MLHLRIPISARLASWLFVGVAALVSLDVLITIGHFVLGVTLPVGVAHAIDLAAEGSIPTWYASAQLLLAALLLGLITTNKRRQRDSYRLAWAALAVGFAYLSLDEAAEIHEMWGLMVGDSVGQTGIFYYQWVVVALVLLPVLLLVFWRFLAHLDSRTRFGMVLSGVVFLGGAVGLELVGGALAANGGRGSYSYAMLNAAENGCELLGIAMFIATLLRYLGRSNQGRVAVWSIRGSTLRAALAAGLVILMGLSVGTSMLEARVPGTPSVISSLFSVVQERNVPTWYTSMLLAVCAFMTALLMAARRNVASGFKGGWTVLAATFAICSIDEMSELHEGLIDWLQLQGYTSKVLWPVIGGALLLWSFILAYRTLRHLPSAEGRAISAAALVWAGGAWLSPIVLQVALARAGRGFGIGLLGEALEIAGASMMVVALARYLSSFGVEVRPSVRDAERQIGSEQLVNV